MKRLIIDTPNLLFRVFAMNQDKIQAAQLNPGGSNVPEGVDDAQYQLGFCLHVALNSMLKYYRMVKPDQVAVVFEGRQNWRKSYTASDACVSKVAYKGNRVRDASYDALFELVDNFRALVTAHTSIVVLHNDYLEGDDLFGGYVQRFTAVGDEVVGVSSDKDYMQLYRLNNFTLINPDTGKDRRIEPKHKDFDAEWYIFEKCVRGDGGDNVPSAWPRVRTTKIRAAFENEYERIQFMNSTWKIVDPDDPLNEEKWTVYRVGDLYEENKLLVDLFAQPPEVRTLIDETLDKELAVQGKWNMFHFLRWCGQYGLNQIADNVTSYADMFAATGRHASDVAIKRVSSKTQVGGAITESTGPTVSSSDYLASIGSNKKVERTQVESVSTNPLIEF